MIETTIPAQENVEVTPTPKQELNLNGSHNGHADDIRFASYKSSLEAKVALLNVGDVLKQLGLSADEIRKKLEAVCAEALKEAMKKYEKPEKA